MVRRCNDNKSIGYVESPRSQFETEGIQDDECMKDEVEDDKVDVDENDNEVLQFCLAWIPKSISWSH